MMTIADNTPDPSGSTDATTTTSSTVSYKTSDTENSATVYYDYVLKVKDVTNPDNAHIRDYTRSSDLDILYG